MEKFNYEENGYNRSEVNNFVKEVIQETEGIIIRVKTQEATIDSLKKELEKYRQMEEVLKKSIIQAEKTSDDIKRMAHEERDIILKDAKNSASRIVNEALLKAEKIEQKKDILERNIKIFKNKLKIIIKQQLAVVDEIEILELEE